MKTAASGQRGGRIATGGGWILMPAPSPHHHSFGFDLAATDGPGFQFHLQYVDHHPAGREGGGFTVHMDDRVRACKHPDGMVQLAGPGVRKPQLRARRGTAALPVHVTVRFKDNGEPGSGPLGPDRFRLEIPGPEGEPGYSSGPEEISGGNVRALNLAPLPICPP